MMRKVVKDKTPEEIKQIKQEEIETPITMEEFEEALKKCSSSVSEAQIKRYEKWMAEFGST